MQRSQPDIDRRYVSHLLWLYLRDLHLKFNADIIKALQVCPDISGRDEEVHYGYIVLTRKGNDWVVKMYLEAAMPQLLP